MLIETENKYIWHDKEITETKYNEILSLLHNRPTAEEGFSYRLTADLQWELYELPVESTDEGV